MGLGDRMKGYYEEPWLFRLPMRLPVILRLDGKCFHTFTMGMDKPHDRGFMDGMGGLSKYLCSEIMGATFAYTQSDEVSIFLHNYRKLTTEGWFANEVQKMASVSAGLASSWFSMRYGREAVFDSRAFVLPEAEVVNYFIWRQRDAVRNSISGYARTMFSHKELQGVDKTGQVCLMADKGFIWGELPTFCRRGVCVLKDEFGWVLDMDTPSFSDDRAYIERWLEVEEE